MNRTGYVIMTNEQKELFYGSGSPHANPEKLAQLKRFSDAQVRAALMGAIHSIAEGKMKFEVNTARAPGLWRSFFLLRKYFAFIFAE